MSVFLLCTVALPQRSTWSRSMMSCPNSQRWFMGTPSTMVVFPMTISRCGPPYDALPLSRGLSGQKDFEITCCIWKMCVMCQYLKVWPSEKKRPVCFLCCFRFQVKRATSDRNPFSFRAAYTLKEIQSSAAWLVMSKHGVNILKKIWNVLGIWHH